MLTRIAPEEVVELDSPLAEFFRTLSGPWPFRPFLALSGKHYIPTADVFARNGELVVKVDLPGVDPKDIHVKLDEGELTIAGERRAAKEVKEEGYYRKETSYGLFERRMTVPKGLKESEVSPSTWTACSRSPCPRSPRWRASPRRRRSRSSRWPSRPRFDIHPPRRGAGS
jgi:HSP20 family molecular chaperone IbpA